MKTQHLDYREITGGRNGYPTPVLGRLIHGFENFEEAEAYAEENNGEVVLAHYRNGWHNCEIKGTVWNAKSVYDFAGENNDVFFYSKEDLKSIEEGDMDFIAEKEGYDNWKEVVEAEGLNLSDEDDAEEVEALKEKLIAKYNQFELGYNLYDFTNGYVESVYEDEYLMSYSEDTHNYIVGVQIKN